MADVEERLLQKQTQRNVARNTKLDMAGVTPLQGRMWQM